MRQWSAGIGKEAQRVYTPVCSCQDKTWKHTPSLLLESIALEYNKITEYTMYSMILHHAIHLDMVGVHYTFSKLT